MIEWILIAVNSRKYVDKHDILHVIIFVFLIETVIIQSYDWKPYFKYPSHTRRLTIYITWISTIYTPGTKHKTILVPRLDVKNAWGCKWCSTIAQNKSYNVKLFYIILKWIFLNVSKAQHVSAECFDMIYMI